MSTRCRTHQAEPSSTGGLDLHAFDRFPQRLGGQPPSGCRAFLFAADTGRSQRNNPAPALAASPASSHSSRMRKKPDGHEYLGAGVEISGLSGELAVESGWRRRFTD